MLSKRLNLPIYLRILSWGLGDTSKCTRSLFVELYNSVNLNLQIDYEINHNSIDFIFNHGSYLWLFLFWDFNHRDRPLLILWL